MKAWAWSLVVVVAACGDNFVPIAPPLSHSGTLFLVAHEDDDMIFMEPELRRALAAGSTTTIYSTTRGEKGADRHLFEAAMMAYGTVVGSSEWDCGVLGLDGIEFEHCRLRDHPVSLVNLALSDGGIPGDRHDSLLHLFDGDAYDLPADDGGKVTAGTVTELFADLVLATSPDRIETLELAGTHGRDHSSHMFVASLGLWASAEIGFSGDLAWHRGYNVEGEAPTLAGADFGAARDMLAHYEACADHCGACGEPCAQINHAHETWLARQYASTRVRTAAGTLALDTACIGADGQLGDCSAAAYVELDASGALRIGDACMTSTPNGTLELAACTGAPEQYWVLDSEGFVWNGRVPEIGANMTFDHVRCLSADRVATCGAHAQARWRFVP